MKQHNIPTQVMIIPTGRESIVPTGINVIVDPPVMPTGTNSWTVVPFAVDRTTSDTGGRTTVSVTIGRAALDALVSKTDVCDMGGRIADSDKVGRTEDVDTAGRTVASDMVGRTDRSNNLI